MIKFYRQQTSPIHHHKRLMPKKVLFFIFAIIIFIGGCDVVKKEKPTPVLMKVENATKQQLLDEVNRFSKVNSLRAKMDLKFEDNSFATFGIKDVYREADGEVVVQRPANIYLKVQVPIIKMDVAQMSSNGEQFRVAVLNDGGDGSYKKFLIGSNSADYSKLQKTIDLSETELSKEARKSVNAFANLRPHHFTDAMLVRPVNSTDVYSVSTIYQVEEDESQKKKSPLRLQMRGYYLLDELKKDNTGEYKISRRFWFDRVATIRLARQQLFDDKGEVESDIVYGREGNLGANSEYSKLPLRIQVTRPKEKYTMSLTYSAPGSVNIGKNYNPDVFVLKNTWGLEEVDLDKKLQETYGQKALVNNQ